MQLSWSNVNFNERVEKKKNEIKTTTNLSDPFTLYTIISGTQRNRTCR